MTLLQSFQLFRSHKARFAGMIMLLTCIASTGLKAQNGNMSMRTYQSGNNLVGIHRVSEGQTLYGIARIYGMSIQELQGLNDLASAAIFPGDAVTVILERNVANTAQPQPQTRNVVVIQNSPQTQTRSQGGIVRELYPNYPQTRSPQTISNDPVELLLGSSTSGYDPYNTEFDPNSISTQEIPEINTKLPDNTMVRRKEYHQVRTGEDLSIIARRFNTTVEQLKAWNGKFEVKQGDILIVKETYEPLFMPIDNGGQGNQSFQGGNNQGTYNYNSGSGVSSGIQGVYTNDNLGSASNTGGGSRGAARPTSGSYYGTATNQEPTYSNYNKQSQANSTYNQYSNQTYNSGRPATNSRPANNSYYEYSQPNTSATTPIKFPSTRTLPSQGFHDMGANTVYHGNAGTYDPLRPDQPGYGNYVEEGTYIEYEANRPVNVEVYAAHKSLPPGSKLRLVMPDGSGVVYVPVIGSLPDRSKAIVGLSRGAIELLRMRGNPQRIRIVY